MINEIVKVVKGYILWQRIKLRYRINNQKIVLVLADENKKLDYFSLVHLEDFVRWKSAKEVVIFVENRKIVKIIKKMDYSFSIMVKVMKKEAMECLYNFYSFDKFFDHIVFTYTSQPKDNLLARVLKETDINEKDTVCLALYHLRTIEN